MSVYYSDPQVTLLLGDALEQLATLPDGSVDCIVTSPAYYGLRDYGTPGQYGLEASPAEYVATMRAVFAEARRVLADDGTLWLNIGDSYASGGRTSYDTRGGNTRANGHAAQRASSELPGKNLLGIPWRVAFALQDDGWILRNAIIWHKPNAMPESVKDRLSNRYEPLFLFTKHARYHFDLDAIREPATEYRGATWEQRKAAGEPGRYGLGGMRSVGATVLAANGNGRNPGDVWSITTRPNPQAHFATFPIDLPIRCIKAGCKPGGTVLDPFSGSGTTGEAAARLLRKYVGIDLNPAYHDLAKKRFAQGVLEFDEGEVPA